MDLLFEIENQRIYAKKDNFVVQHSNKYLRLLFDFITEDWTGLTIFIILKNDKKEAFLFNYDSEGIIVPGQIVAGNQFYVSVYGTTAENQRITTNEVGVILARTGYTTDISSISEETEDVFSEVKRLLDSKFDTVTFEDGVLFFSNNKDDLLGSVDLSDYFNTVVSNEIKAALRSLAETILK